ncbi:IS701 family transposase [Streptomyces tailanensis]|uniref:IS701 family transposase n=1 Tax=Streptomyces tailanensis TaxID=2569858 RepID=UPI001FEBE7D0|nr:transposase [Streptomyces tailanensis]
MLDKLSASLFTSLRRSDQREKGMKYIRGLLLANGRKSIRNIASLVGGQAAEQSLHHFVCASTWGWAPVRRELAHFVVGARPPWAWVVRPVVIPKAGVNTVGVDRCELPDSGQMRGAQRALGVWAVSGDIASPVNWRLQLSSAWVDNAIRRNRVSIPDHAGAETLTECGVNAYVETLSWGFRPLPVIIDAWEGDGLAHMEKLRAAGAPFLLRVNGDVRLSVPHAKRSDRRRGEPAQQIMEAAGWARRPVAWTDPSLGGGIREGLAAGVQVAAPLEAPWAGSRAHREDLLLMGLGGRGAGNPWPQELWLTNLHSARLGDLVRLSSLTRRVERDFDEIGDRVGLKDFTGRSFGGWHRHITLASAAHAIVAMSRERPKVQRTR